MKTMQKLSALLLALALSASLLTACGNAASSTATSTPVSSVAASEAVSSAVASEAAAEAAIAVTFQVTDKDGNVTEYPLEAQAGESLADALLAAQLISQEEHDAGFVTVVGEIATDYDADKSWWALVDANGEMTAVGIADIALAEGDTYGFVYTVG